MLQRFVVIGGGGVALTQVDVHLRDEAIVAESERVRHAGGESRLGPLLVAERVFDAAEPAERVGEPALVSYLLGIPERRLQHVELLARGFEDTGGRPLQSHIDAATQALVAPFELVERQESLSVLLPRLLQ